MITLTDIAEDEFRVLEEAERQERMNGGDYVQSLVDTIREIGV